MVVHYQEIVTNNVSAHCELLQKLHGVSFGAEVPELGNARVANGPDGRKIGVRAPLAGHETPIVRTYVSVPDIDQAVREAESAGAAIAYPPTRQGDTGTWAIFILDDIQYGLWQQ